MMSAESVLPAMGGMGILVSGTLVVSASTTGSVVAVGLGAAEAPDAAGLAEADAAGLALAEAAAEAAGLALAGAEAAADAGLAAAALEAGAGGLDGAAPPPQAARNSRHTVPRESRQGVTSSSFWPLGRRAILHNEVKKLRLWADRRPG